MACVPYAGERHELGRQDWRGAEGSLGLCSRKLPRRIVLSDQESRGTIFDFNTIHETRCLLCRCRGANDNGALGLGDTANRGTDPSQMGSALPFSGFGAEESGGLVAVAGGRQHTCALGKDDRVWCW